MNVGKARAIFLRYLDEATSNGSPVLESQYADYTDKFNYFLDSAQKYLATIKKIEARLTVNSSDVTAAPGAPFVELQLPDDFYLMGRVESGYGIVDWRMYSKSSILISSRADFPVDIFYFKLPAELSVDEPDETEFELDEDIQMLIPLQAGIEATAASNAALSSWLRSIYSEKMQNIMATEKNYENRVQSVYSI